MPHRRDVVRCARSLLVVATLVSAANGFVAVRAEAQTYTSGLTVRVWAISPHLRRFTATIEEVRGDTLVLRQQTAAPSTPLLLPAASIGRLEIRTPRTPEQGAAVRAVQGAGIGLLAGSALVAAVLLDTRGCDGCALVAFVAPPLFAVAGAPIGAVIGYYHPGSGWACATGTPCAPPSVLARRAPRPRGFGVQIALSRR